MLMGGGLVLFGVGAGNGLGGLLNAFTGGGSTAGQKSVVSQHEKNALKADHSAIRTTRPAWANLVQARWTSAGQDSQLQPSAPASSRRPASKELNAGDAGLAALHCR